MLDYTAEFLVNAKRPLFFMGSETSTEAMAVGIAIAEELGGLVDGNATICHGPTVMAVQDAGQVASTLGECKNRADLNIYRGCNPIDSHPRHMSSFSHYPRGFFTESGDTGFGRTGERTEKTPFFGKSCGNFRGMTLRMSLSALWSQHRMKTCECPSSPSSAAS